MARGAKLAVLLLVLGAAIAAQSPQVRFPDPDIGVTTLNARARAQRASVDRFKVVYDFQFTDRVKESGITFVHRVVDGDGLPDIYFTNQIGGNQLWKNLGGGRFADVTKDAGVALADRISVTASFADVDNDGDEDLFVTTVRGGNVLFLNDGKGHFRDVSKQSGLDYVGKYTTDEKGRGGYYVGFADAFSGHLMPERAERSRLYRNLGGGHFAD